MHVKVITKPITKLLKYLPIPFLYACGYYFKISIFIKNLGSQTFPGGRLNILVTYAFGNLREIIPGIVPSVNAGEEKEVDLKGQTMWGILAQGHALFLANLIDVAGNFVPLCNERSQLLQKQNLGYHVHTFYSLTRGELYTLIALWISVASTILLNIEKIMNVLRFLMPPIN